MRGARGSSLSYIALSNLPTRFPFLSLPLYRTFKCALRFVLRRDDHERHGWKGQTSGFNFPLGTSRDTRLLLLYSPEASLSIQVNISNHAFASLAEIAKFTEHEIVTGKPRSRNPTSASALSGSGSIDFDFNCHVNVGRRIKPTFRASSVSSSYTCPRIRTRPAGRGTRVTRSSSFNDRQIGKVSDSPVSLR